MDNPQVLIMMGSKNDLEHIEPGIKILRELMIPFELRVASAHRTPERVSELSRNAARRGVKVIVAAAGAAAHLAGAVAAQTMLPVLGVPVASTPLAGFDALLSMAQMPAGMPVGVMSVGGAANASLLAARIISLGDEALRGRLETWQAGLKIKVEEGDREIQERFKA